MALRPEYPPQQILRAPEGNRSDAPGLQAALDMAQDNSLGGYSPRRVAALGVQGGATAAPSSAVALQATPGDSGLGRGLQAFLHPDASLPSAPRSAHATTAAPSALGISDVPPPQPPQWTRAMDEALLHCMLQRGSGAEVVQGLVEQLKTHDSRCTAEHVSARLQMYSSKL